MIIITGGRSGTSFMVKWFKECGFDIGSDLWYGPVNAGYENKETGGINSTMLGAFVKGKKINIYRVWGNIHDLNYDVVKDPQFLTHTHLIKNWWKVRKDLKVIFLHRNLADVVESMKKVPEWNTPVYRMFPDMLEKKQDSFLRMLARLEIPHLIYKFPHFLGDGKKIIKELSTWVDFPEGERGTLSPYEIWQDLRE